MVWVKICGTTSLEDAQAAVDAGADALGFIFAESPRRVAPLVARDIVRSLPERIEKIGVFVNATAEHICEIVAKVGLTGVQIHGDDELRLAMSLTTAVGARGPLIVMPVFPVGYFGLTGELLGKRRDILRRSLNIHRVVYDTAAKGKWGGTGKTWDWAAVVAQPPHLQLVVAGGLTPANVSEAIHATHAWGVDVTTGVECEPGKKDHEKVRAFVNAAKSTDRWADFRHLMNEFDKRESSRKKKS